ncbi:MAG: hypothetical protein LBQ40_06780 [Clostridiales bacterium]|jgi:predicted  nucleic acid-binding Zn-ribbon protein|nr:hypothetical protein [Clostridiales bacterium]
MTIMDKILEYQRVDRLILNLENELKDSKPYKEMTLCQKNIHESVETIKKYENDAKEIINSYGRLDENVTESEDNKSELVSAVNSINGDAGTDSLGEYEFYLKKLEKERESLTVGDSELSKTRRRIDEITAMSTKLLKVIYENTEKKKRAAAAFEEIKNQRKEEADALIKQKNALEAQLPKETVEAYKVIRNEKRLPAFVELVDKNLCKGCGMDVPFDVLTKLKNPGDYSECPNCRRFLYMK